MCRLFLRVNNLLAHHVVRKKGGRATPDCDLQRNSATWVHIGETRANWRVEVGCLSRRTKKEEKGTRPHASPEMLADVCEKLDVPEVEFSHAVIGAGTTLYQYRHCPPASPWPT
jgi:hypothetical protein